MKFVNDAVAIEKGKSISGNRPGEYGYKKPSKYLFQWSGLLQRVVSQAGSFLMTGKFHSSHCAIYKCEGGCVIKGAGELVLGPSGCYIDSVRSGPASKAIQDKEAILADLITHLVLGWDPNNPITSMLDLACEYLHKNTPVSFKVLDYSKPKHEAVFHREIWDIDTLKANLKNAIESSTNGGVFGGNSLSYFFDWNPFGKPPIDRPYQRWCLVNFSGMTEKEVDQKFADEDLGEVLLEKMQTVIRELNKGRYGLLPMCCSPSRGRDGLRFWVNTGAFTQIDGWKTQKELEDYIKNPMPLIRDYENKQS